MLRVNYYTWGVQLPESLNRHKKNPVFIFRCKRVSVRVRLRDGVCLRKIQCVNAELDEGLDGGWGNISCQLNVCLLSAKLWTISRLSVKVAPYSFLSARALISKISRGRKLSNSTPKSRGGPRSKMPTNMASKLLQFVYRKCCVDRLRFQNICRLNRRPQLSLLDVKVKYTRQAGVSTNEVDFM